MRGMPDQDGRADLVVSRPPTGVTPGRGGRAPEVRDRPGMIPRVTDLHHHGLSGVQARPPRPSRAPAPAVPAWASAEARRAGLTRREWHVLAVLITGAPNRQISARLHISPRTVTNHLASIFAKLGTRTRTEAVARAVEIARLYES
jgi:DNA-binding CsgD family transcriptional regulator